LWIRSSLPSARALINTPERKILFIVDRSFTCLFLRKIGIKLRTIFDERFQAARMKEPMNIALGKLRDHDLPVYFGGSG